MSTEEQVRRNRNRSWWERRTKLEKKGFILLILSLIIIIGLIIGICCTRAQKNNGKDHSIHNKTDNKTCLTIGCIKAAADLLKNIDETADPCEDFYDFACGRYRKEVTIPEDKSEINNFLVVGESVKRQLKLVVEQPIKSDEPKPTRLAKRFYKICMNTTALEAEGLEPIKKIIRQTGGWPVMEGRTWNEIGFDWKTNIYQFRKHGLSFSGIFNFEVEVDARNATRRILSIDQAKLDISKENLLNGIYDFLVDSYYSYLVDLAETFGADRAMAEYDMRSVIDFQINLARVSLSEEERRNQKDLFHPITIAELQNKYRSIPWTEFINNVLGNPHARVDPTIEINVKVPEYLDNVEELLYSTPKRVQANHAYALAVRAFVDYLPKQVQDRDQQFLATEQSTSVKPPRWIQCIDKVSEHLPIATGVLYVRNYFPEDTKQMVNEMVIDVKKQLVKIIEKLEWMDASTKKIAVDKAESIHVHVGYPAEFLDDRKLEEYYTKLNITSSNYFEAASEISLFESDRGLSEFQSPINTTDWKTRMSATEINAQYVLPENSIELPAGILQGVFFGKERPRYINYGSMGFIIGHEITHGFDDQGKEYNKLGGLENWWEENTDKAFSERAKCFIKQYGNYVVPQVGMKLNGEITQSENIADNSGIKEAYLAYNSWVERNGPEPVLPGLNYTAKQLFWISAASCWCSIERDEALKNDISQEEHSPNRYRVNVPFGNSHYFAEDFNCPKISKMAFQHQCEMW